MPDHQEHEEKSLTRGGKWGRAQADLPRRNDGFSQQELRHD